MTVFKRKLKGGKRTKNYYVKFQKDGKQIYKSTGCASKQAAEKWARDYADKIRGESQAKHLVEKYREPPSVLRVNL